MARDTNTSTFELGKLAVMQ